MHKLHRVQNNYNTFTGIKNPDFSFEISSSGQCDKNKRHKKFLHCKQNETTSMITLKKIVQGVLETYEWK